MLTIRGRLITPLFLGLCSDSSFVYGFMSLDNGFGTMTATTFISSCDSLVVNCDFRAALCYVITQTRVLNFILHIF